MYTYYVYIYIYQIHPLQKPRATPQNFHRTIASSRFVQAEIKKMTLKTMPQPRFWAEDFHGFFDESHKNRWFLVVFIPCQALKFGFKTWKHLGILTPAQKKLIGFFWVCNTFQSRRDLWHNSSIPLIGCTVLSACWWRVAALRKSNSVRMGCFWTTCQPVKKKNNVSPFFSSSAASNFWVEKNRHLEIETTKDN